MLCLAAATHIARPKTIAHICLILDQTIYVLMLNMLEGSFHSQYISDLIG